MRNTQREKDEFEATQKLTGCVISVFMLVGIVAIGIMWYVISNHEPKQQRYTAPKEGVNPMFVKNYER